MDECLLVPLIFHSTTPAAAVAGAAGLGLLLALARPHAVLAFARAHEWFILGAAGIGLTAVALATGLMLAVRR